MLGFSELREQYLWVEVSDAAQSVSIEYWPAASPEDKKLQTNLGPFTRPFNPVGFTLGYLEPGTEYWYRILIDGQPLETRFPQHFRTQTLWQWRTPAPDFSFLFGSCLYTSDTPFDRPGTPYGQGNEILDTMLKAGADFMLWGGDNLYLREVDYCCPSGIRYRYHHFKADPHVRRILAAMPNYAIWDDHDFGPNNSDRGYALKDTALQAFRENWGNRTYGHNGHPGVYSTFSWNDCDFFLLDNRYHRAPNDMADSLDGQPNLHKAYWGPEQMQWLQDALLQSRASFKFIVNGNQVLNINCRHEALHRYPAEMDELLQFLRSNDVRGVVFLTGDRHFTELIRYDAGMPYPLYEITSSPLSSRPYTTIGESPEGDNPLRVPGTLVNENNFARLSVSGERGRRVLKIEAIGKDGQVRWTYELEQQKLRDPASE